MSFRLTKINEGYDAEVNVVCDEDEDEEEVMMMRMK